MAKYEQTVNISMREYNELKDTERRFQKLKLADYEKAIGVMMSSIALTGATNAQHFMTRFHQGLGAVGLEAFMRSGAGISSDSDEYFVEIKKKNDTII